MRRLLLAALAFALSGGCQDLARDRGDGWRPLPTVLGGGWGEQRETDEGVKVVLHGARGVGKVALTFDDGPTGDLTRRVSALLERRGVQATFFVLGNQADKRPKVLGELIEAGHELALHGYDHKSFKLLVPSELRGQLRKTADAVEVATGLRPRLLRPPYGRYPDSALDIFAEEQLDVVLWSIDSEDWSKDNDPSTIARNVVKTANPGSIILLHDVQLHTYRALPEIITGLRQKGLEPVRVSELTGMAAYR